jgi:hypothetical protein
MAKDAESLAKKEQRTVSELFREAFRSYRAQRAAAAFEELDRISRARNTNPSGYTQKDVDRLVDEARQQLEGERKPKRLKAAKK